MKNTINIVKLNPEAIVPKYATAGAACFDLHALSAPASENFYTSPFVIFRTGLAFEIPEGYAMLIYSRSGMGFKENTRLANCVGVIDSDYRGEVMVKLTRDDGLPVSHHHGDRIAQAMIVPVQQVEFNVVGQLSKTARGTGGFGSTGA